jgi:hypothetical protein
MSSEPEIVDVDETGKILLKDNMLTLTKDDGSVFDLQKKKVAAGTLKKSLVFERKLDRAGKKDMPVS